MLHAAAMVIGTLLLWLLASGPAVSVDNLWIGIAAACAATLVALRFGGASGAFVRLPARLIRAPLWTQASLGAVMQTAASALAADVTIRPALVRVKTKLNDARARAILAGLVSAHPGIVVVETDREGVLVHALNEDKVDAEALGALEARAKKMGGSG